MKRHPITHTKVGLGQRGQDRRGSILVLSAAFMLMIFAFTAFTVDVGYIALTKSQLQAAADASALSAGMDLVDGWGLGAAQSLEDVDLQARQSAVEIAALHRGGDRTSITIDGSRNVRLGQRVFDSATGVWNESWGTAPYNLIEVTVRRSVAEVQSLSGNSDGPLPLFFGPVLGKQTADVSAVAVAALMPGSGFRIDPGSGQNAMVLPIAYDVESWDAMLDGDGDDDYRYDPNTGAITNGSDGILEIDLYPTGKSELPPGNRGTVDFGSSNNSTNDIKRQILHGLSEEDLSYFGGRLCVDPDPLLVNGDTGLSAGIKSQLTEIIGQPRAIPLYSKVSGPGNNATYTIVRFVGIRLLEVKLTGGNKYVKAQAAPFVDSTVIRSSVSQFEPDSIMAPIMLLR